MTLGLLVTRDGYAEEIVGLTKQALKKGHKVIIFMTDKGVLNIKNTEVVALKDFADVDMSLCNFSVENNNLPGDIIPDGITAGSQFQNAVMVQESDKIIVF